MFAQYRKPLVKLIGGEKVNILCVVPRMNRHTWLRAHGPLERAGWTHAIVVRNGRALFLSGIILTANAQRDQTRGYQRIYQFHRSILATLCCLVG
jgi:hypothetical protein